MKIKRSDFLKLMSVTAASAVLAGCGSSVVEQAAQSTANSQASSGPAPAAELLRLILKCDLLKSVFLLHIRIFLMVHLAYKKKRRDSELRYYRCPFISERKCIVKE